MPEILLHYIWQHQIWAGFAQQTTDGQSLEIVSVGKHNIHAGPDFSQAHIRINGQDWIGNIEIHVHASDWYKHRHHNDPAYDNTILHVVAKADKEVENSRGERIVQCELQYPQNKDYITQLLNQSTLADIPCGKQLLTNPSLLTHGWKAILLEKRLECKWKSIQQLLDITQQSWAHAFYISLAHNFGFHINGLPFEALALATPLSCLQKHKDNLFQLTAILLGQSGLLEKMVNNSDEYNSLWQEYCFLQKKFQLCPINGNLWKRGRMRPQNMPEVRIRQFAHLLYQSEFLFAKMMDERDVERMIELLTLQYGAEDVYTQVQRPLPLGRKSIEILLINTIIPYQYAYAQGRITTNRNQIASESIAALEKITKEDNTIIRQWTMLGQHVESAADTQALLHLYQNYCQPHLCYNCHVGHQVFTYKQLELF